VATARPVNETTSKVIPAAPFTLTVFPSTLSVGCRSSTCSATPIAVVIFMALAGMEQAKSTEQAKTNKNLLFMHECFVITLQK
jgi:hypothetical protein